MSLSLRWRRSEAEEPAVPPSAPESELDGLRLHQAEASAALGLGRSCRAGAAAAAVWSRAEMGRERRMEVDQRWAELQSKAAASAHAGAFGLAVGEEKIWVGDLFTVQDAKN